MTNKKQKKEKKKLIKIQQKEIRARNKEKYDKEIKNENQEEIKENQVDFDNITEFSGTKGYALVKLNEIIESLRNKENNDEKIWNTARELKDFATNTQSIYNNFLNNSKKNISKKRRSMINRGKYNLNNTERALLKSKMVGVQMEYLTKDLSIQSPDYTAMKAYFQCVQRLLILGLKEKKIKKIDLYVGYEDELCDAKITYEDDNDKYNLDKYIDIFSIWHSLDRLYHWYSIYKCDYKNFDEKSCQSLATATATLEEYDKREEGKELVSYNGIVLNYVAVLEHELKKLVSKKFDLDMKKLKLVDVINYLGKADYGILSEDSVINSLHKVRLLRNKVAHGDSISYKECKCIQSFLIDSQILEFISWEL